jgi:hypothetical protein
MEERTGDHDRGVGGTGISEGVIAFVLNWGFLVTRVDYLGSQGPGEMAPCYQ